MTPTDDELRARLGRIDPMPPSVPVEPASGPRARELMERIVQTRPVQTQPSPTDRTAHPSPWWQRPITAVAAVALVAGLGVGAVIALGGSDPGSEPTVMALDGGGAEDPLAMCMQVTAENLAAFPVAFAGTAVEVADGIATLDVTRWYRGGDADRVAIAAPPAQPALIGGVDIEVGGRYLVTADEGRVSSCYFSDVASPELEALYAEAFGG